MDCHRVPRLVQEFSPNRSFLKMCCTKIWLKQPRRIFKSWMWVLATLIRKMPILVLIILGSLRHWEVVAPSVLGFTMSTMYVHNTIHNIILIRNTTVDGNSMHCMPSTYSSFTWHPYRHPSNRPCIFDTWRSTVLWLVHTGGGLVKYTDYPFLIWWAPKLGNRKK